VRRPRAAPPSGTGSPLESREAASECRSADQRIRQHDEVARARTSPAAGIARASWGDALFENLTRLFALLVFGLLAAILASLVIGSQLTLSKYGPSFLWSAQWDPVQENFGALVPIYGTLVTSLIAMLIGVPVSFASRSSSRSSRRPGSSVRSARRSSCWRRSVDHLRHVGLFVFVPLFQAHVQPGADSIARLGAGFGRLFAGPPLGIGMLTAG